MTSSIGPTFVAALRAVGTASTMAFAGIYLHRRGFVTVSGKKMMALLSQQVTIPAFLFAKIIFCPNPSGSGSSSRVPNDMSETFDDGPPEIVCPSVANRISNLWMLLLWPAYVVLCGLCTGYFAARLSNTPPVQTRSCLAACAFGNSTGLPITLLSVIHKQFRETTELGRIDPTAFLSVYLLLYPVLQWGVGGWLLAPEEKKEEDGYVNKGTSMNGKNCDKEAGNNATTETSPLLSSHRQGSQKNESNDSANPHGGHVNQPLHISHLLNYEPQQSPTMAAGQEEFGGVRSRHLVLTNGDNKGPQRFYTAGYTDSTSSTLAMMVKELSFTSFSLGHHGSSGEFQLPSSPAIGPSYQNDSASGNDSSMLQRPELDLEKDDGPLMMDAVGEATAAVESFISDTNAPTVHHVPLINENGSTTTLNSGIDGFKTLHRDPSRQQIEAMQEADILPLTETLLRISGKVFQPPVIGALLGLFIASFPGLRGLLENIWGDDKKTAPLKWMFDGIYSVGQAAVPINMTILGINLSSTFQKKKSKKSGNKNDEHNDDKSKMLSNKTMLAVVIGKMIVMPIIGIISTWFFKKYYIDLPDEIDSTCYLVMMIVFITPTANNVMVMVELSGSSSKEGMARLIGWQYVASPVILSLVLSVVVNLASCHFDTPEVGVDRPLVCST